MLSDRHKRAIGAFFAGYTLCFLMVRVLVTQDATLNTWLAAIVIPMGLARALRRNS